jgi:tetratricopeptide (TPR) repeat protein
LANFQNEREQLVQLEGLFQQQKFTDGLAQVEAVLSQFPASLQLRFLKFKFLRELNRTGEALQLLRETHAMFGDNIMVLKELADLHFKQKQFPESLLYYNKLLFLDSFNSQAQERVKHIQGTLEAGLVDKLADTKVEFRPADTAAAPAPPELLVIETEAPPHITFAADGGPAALPEAPAAAPEGQGMPFETESAAELYFKQGLYQEALAIYKNLFEKTGRTDFFLKIKAILMLLRTDRNGRIIEQLQRFLQLIQQRGRQSV